MNVDDRVATSGVGLVGAVEARMADRERQLAMEREFGRRLFIRDRLALDEKMLESAKAMFDGARRPRLEDKVWPFKSKLASK